MSEYLIREIDGVAWAEVLHYFNGKVPEFPLLEQRHFERGYWWLALTASKTIVGFAGMVPDDPFDDVGYMKRAYVTPAHRGRGIQGLFLKAREAKAAQVGWTMLVSECSIDNVHSQRNFVKAGFRPCNPEQAWGSSPESSVYFVKRLAAK